MPEVDQTILSQFEIASLETLRILYLPEPYLKIPSNLVDRMVLVPEAFVVRLGGNAEVLNLIFSFILSTPSEKVKTVMKSRMLYAL